MTWEFKFIFTRQQHWEKVATASNQTQPLDDLTALDDNNFRPPSFRRLELNTLDSHGSLHALKPEGKRDSTNNLKLDIV